MTTVQTSAAQTTGTPDVPGCYTMSNGTKVAVFASSSSQTTTLAATSTTGGASWASLGTLPYAASECIAATVYLGALVGYGKDGSGIYFHGAAFRTGTNDFGTVGKTYLSPQPASAANISVAAADFDGGYWHVASAVTTSSGAKRIL